MKNLAPNLTRQRLLIEGFYKIKVNRKTVENYFRRLTKSLKLKAYGKPIIFSPGGIGKEENQGYGAFVPLIDSGIAAYVWANVKFFSIVIYICKSFHKKTAVSETKRFFKADKIVFQNF